MSASSEISTLTARGASKRVRRDRGQIDIVADCGAKGDGSHNDRQNIQDAIDRAIDRLGGKILIPTGTFLVQGLQDTSASNGILSVPYRSLSEQIVSIEFIGDAPVQIADWWIIDQAKAKGPVILSDTTGSNSAPAIITGGNWQRAADGADFGYSNVSVSFRHLIFRQPPGPSLNGIQWYKGGHLRVRNVHFDIDASVLSITKPTNVDAAAVVCPANANEATTIVDDVNAFGWYSAVNAGEHSELSRIRAYFCNRAVQFGASTHGLVCGRVSSNWNTYGLVFTGQCYGDIGPIDVEKAAPSGFAYDIPFDPERVDDIHDPSNYHHGTIRGYSTIGGSATATPLVVTGAANSRIIDMYYDPPAYSGRFTANFYDATVAAGSTTIDTFGDYEYQSGGAQHDELVWDKIPLDAGTYAVQVVGKQSTNTGIQSLFLNADSSAFGTLDWYHASATAWKRQTATMTVGYSGLHKIRSKMATKNASSTGYFLIMKGITAVKS